jgi:hypothetical protein
MISGTTIGTNPIAKNGQNQSGVELSSLTPRLYPSRLGDGDHGCKMVVLHFHRHTHVRPMARN